MQECMEEKLTFLKYINERYLFYFITILAFVGVGALLYIQSTFSYFEKKKIPRGNLPKFPYGNIKDVVFQKSTLYEFLWKYYNRFKRKGYKFAGLYLFTKPSVLTVNQSIVYRVLSEDKYFVDLYSPKKSCVDSKKLLNLLHTAKDSFLGSFNNIRDGLLVRNLEINEDLENVMRNFFLETYSVHFGFNSCEILEEINLLLRSKTQASFFHYLRLVFPSFKTKNKRLDRDLRDIIDEIMEIRKKNDIRKYDIIQNFIDLYNLDDNISFEDIVTEIFDSFINNLNWSYSSTLLCLHELAANEEIQEELVGEIRRFNKENMSLNVENMEDLVYLDAVVKETLRKYPQVPLVLKHCTEGYKNTDLNLDLPKDIFVFVSILGIHRDSNYYTNPESFDPDRFSEESRKSIKANTFLPFGFGPRSQISMNLTTLHTKLCLMTILSKFSVGFRKDSSEIVQFDPTKLTIQPKEPVDFQFQML